MDIGFFYSTFMTLIAGLPLTLQLAGLSLLIGMGLAILLTAMRMSGLAALSFPVRAYVFVFRGTPLLIQIFIIYYGLGQFEAVRNSIFWVFLREPFWCAVLALALNTAAYTSEIIRGGVRSVPPGQIEAARACGMSGLLLVRRMIFPIALRQALPMYGSEIILMTKATALASVITLFEVTGLAHKLISSTYRSVEVFACAGIIYLSINFAVVRLVSALERKLSPQAGKTSASAKPLKELALK